MTMRSAQRLEPEDSTSGFGDVLDELERDHREVDSLFALASLTEGDLRARAVDEIVRALSVHAVVEEEVVYPAIEATLAGGDALATRARDEHQEMKELLARIDKVDADERESTDLLRRLQTVVQAHVAVEEAELWPAYRAVVDPSVLADLTSAATGARDRAPTRPHPHAPDTPPGNVVAGVLAGAIDKVRDAVRGPDAGEGSSNAGKGTPSKARKATATKTRKATASKARTGPASKTDTVTPSKSRKGKK